MKPSVPSYPISPTGAQRTRKISPLAVVCTVLLIVALGFGFWYWQRLSRPGRVHNDRGMDYAAAQNFAQAEREWKLGVQEDPTYPDCYERLGDLYRMLKNYPNAITYYEGAAKWDPKDGPLFKTITAMHLAERDVKGALPSAKRAYELLPNDAEAAGSYGDLAQQQKDIPAALTALRHAHELDPANGQYVLKLANVEMDVERYADAERDLTSYLKINPKDVWACYLMAVIYNHKVRTPDNLHTAIAYAERCASSSKPPLQVYPLLAQLYLDTNRTQDARRACDIALKDSPNDAGVLYQLVACYRRLHQPELANQASALLGVVNARHDRIYHLKLTMGFNPSDVASGLELARLQEQDDNPDMAEACYVKVARDNPHDPRPRAALADFLRRTGRPELAKRLDDPNFTP